MDEAKPQGMPRPRIKTTHKGYSNEPTPSRSRPMTSVHKRNYAVGEGNAPKGMKRPVDPSTEIVIRALREG